MARKLTEETKSDIEKALMMWAGPLKEGAAPEHILHQCALHACALLEIADEHPEWFKEK